MTEQPSLVVPDLDDVAEDNDAEPLDAGVNNPPPEDSE